MTTKMTARYAAPKGTRKAKPARRTGTSRTTKTRTPKNGKSFNVPVSGKRQTVPSAWYFGR